MTLLKRLHLSNNQLTSLPKSLSQLTLLKWLDLGNNQLTDLSPLEKLNQEDLQVIYFGVYLPRRYWTKFSDWQPEWLLDENNAEIRRVLIQHVGYEKICNRLGTKTIDNWQAYELLKIDGVEAVNFSEVFVEEIYEHDIFREVIRFSKVIANGREPMVLLKMNCPSTEHIHILRVPPETTSAEAAITWINHGIHPDKFSVQT